MDISSRYQLHDLTNISSRYQLPKLTNTSSRYQLPDLTDTSSRYQLTNLTDTSSRYQLPELTNTSSRYQIPDLTDTSSRYQLTNNLPTHLLDISYMFFWREHLVWSRIIINDHRCSSESSADSTKSGQITLVCNDSESRHTCECRLLWLDFKANH